MSAYWDAVKKIETELRTKPRDVAVFCLYGIEEKIANTAPDTDERRAHEIVSYAVDRVVYDHLKRELLSKTKVADRIAYIRSSTEGISLDPLERLSYRVIENNLDELFPEAGDRALDTFDDRFPNDDHGENWHTHLADHYATAAIEAGVS